MRAHELVEKINETAGQLNVTGSTIMVLGSDGLPMTPTEVVIDEHDDGSHTVWIKVEDV